MLPGLAGGGGGTTGGSVGTMPSSNEPFAGRTSAPASMIHLYFPSGAPVPSQVQSTSVPLPRANAPANPGGPLTVTDQSRASERRPVKRTIRLPCRSARGSKSFGRPDPRRRGGEDPSLM